jgi:hypothetical protein
VTSQGDEVFWQALALGAVFGTVLAIAFAGFGLLVSTWSNANKTSFFITLVTWLLLFMLTQLPGEVQKGDFGYFVQRINPMQAISEFLEKVLVNHRTIAEKAEYLRSSFLAIVAVLFVLFVIAAPRLRLHAGTARRMRARWGSLSGMLIASTAIITIVIGASAGAAEKDPTKGEGDLAITMDRTYLQVRTGDEVDFQTLLENDGDRDSPPVIMALNIIKLTSTGDVVDPEDWSPERTQYVDSVSSHDAVRQNWTIEAILKGDYMVYLVAIPQPDKRSTSHPISGPGLHLAVGAFQRLNPQGVLPVVIAVPLGVAIALLVLVRLRLRRLSRDVPAPPE